MKILNVKYFWSFLVFFIAFLKEKASYLKVLLKKIKRFAHSKDFFFWIHFKMDQMFFEKNKFSF